MRDASTMLRRNLRHAMRYPSMTISVVAMPVLMLLVFVFVFGGALRTGLGVRHAIDFVAPGMILIAASAGAMTTAVAVCADMTEGIVDRFRSMSISRAAMLTGHVAAGVIQTMASVVVVIGVSLIAGFRPTAGLLAWMAAGGLLALVCIGLTWISAALGVLSKRVETASNVTLPLQFLPFLGSAVVPPQSMAAGVRWFARYQPFTPIIDTLRGLLTGGAIGDKAVIAVGWCLLMALGGYVWARSAFTRATC